MADEIQQNRYDQLLRRVGGLIGPGAKVAEVLSELFPTLDVESVPAELLLLGGTRICQGGGQIAATAGQAPTAQLFNPADSGMLVTITRVMASASATVRMRWGVVPVVRGAGIGTGKFTDTRLLSPELPVAQVRTETAVALASGTQQVASLANTGMSVEDQNAVAVLAPDTGFEIGTAELNVTLNFAFQWRERVAEESELKL